MASLKACLKQQGRQQDDDFKKDVFESDLTQTNRQSTTKNSNIQVQKEQQRKTGYVWCERFMWHHAGKYVFDDWTQPVRHFESPETKRRLHNLLDLSGLLDKMVKIEPRKATRIEMMRFHAKEYLDKLQDMSKENGGDAGDAATFTKGGFEIAALAAGGAIRAVEKVLEGTVDNAYVLCRPPGHHAERDQGMGFCLLNNVVLACFHALDVCGVTRIAVVDYDVHHGNGTQQAFYNDDRVLFISIHQDSNYPPNSGSVGECGEDIGLFYNINIPLPPGSGSGAYLAAFDLVIKPAISIFQPQLILVSSGFDASFLDPLATMMLTSNDFRFFAKELLALASTYCGGKVVFIHEGGYSDVYVPFCGVAVIEELTGVQTEVKDTLQEDGLSWGYQECQAHQYEVIRLAQANVNQMKMQREANHTQKNKPQFE